MSDYGTIYLIETNYNADRDAREVTFGYIEKEEDVKGAVEAGLAKARALASRAAGAAYEPD